MRVRSDATLLDAQRSDRKRSSNMAKTVIGLMEDAAQGKKVVEELLESGFRRQDIGFIARDVHGEAEGVLKGTLTGVAVGAITGMLLAASAFMVPGLGPVLVAGPMAGAAVGALAGGLANGFMHEGVPEDEAHFYAEGVRRGGALVTVNAENDELAARAVEIMKRYGAVDIDQRAAEWREQGWNGRSASDATQPVAAHT
jgi:hypothetical protein